MIRNPIRGQNNWSQGHSIFISYSSLGKRQSYCICCLLLTWTQQQFAPKRFVFFFSFSFMRSKIPRAKKNEFGSVGLGKKKRERQMPDEMHAQKVWSLVNARSRAGRESEEKRLAGCVSTTSHDMQVLHQTLDYYVFTYVDLVLLPFALLCAVRLLCSGLFFLFSTNVLFASD